MITSDYLRVMARYNRWQNGEVYAAVSRLVDNARREDRGAFFGSILGTLSHLYWADRIWLSRFDLVEPPRVPINESASFVEDFEELAGLREAIDTALIEFCDSYDKGSIKGSLEWFSGAINANAKAPLGVIFIHFFNHQTHHRGQVNAMITAAGERTGDTDLFLMPPEHWPV